MEREAAAAPHVAASPSCCSSRDCLAQALSACTLCASSHSALRPPTLPVPTAALALTSSQQAPGVRHTGLLPPVPSGQYWVVQRLRRWPAGEDWHLDLQGIVSTTAPWIRCTSALRRSRIAPRARVCSSLVFFSESAARSARA